MQGVAAAASDDAASGSRKSKFEEMNRDLAFLRGSQPASTSDGGATKVFVHGYFTSTCRGFSQPDTYVHIVFCTSTRIVVCDVFLCFTRTLVRFWHLQTASRGSGKLGKLFDTSSDTPKASSSSTALTVSSATPVAAPVRCPHPQQNGDKKFLLHLWLLHVSLPCLPVTNCWLCLFHRSTSLVAAVWSQMTLATRWSQVGRLSRRFHAYGISDPRSPRSAPEAEDAGRPAPLRALPAALGQEGPVAPSSSADDHDRAYDRRFRHLRALLDARPADVPPASQRSTGSPPQQPQQLPGGPGESPGEPSAAAWSPRSAAAAGERLGSSAMAAFRALCRVAASASTEASRESAGG
jgi:hypothetical protein